MSPKIHYDTVHWVHIDLKLMLKLGWNPDQPGVTRPVYPGVAERTLFAAWEEGKRDSCSLYHNLVQLGMQRDSHCMTLNTKYCSLYPCTVYRLEPTLVQPLFLAAAEPWAPGSYPDAVASSYICDFGTRFWLVLMWVLTYWLTVLALELTGTSAV